MNCPKHPSQKMIQLFTSWACDLCDPPKAKVYKVSQTKLKIGDTTIEPIDSVSVTIWLDKYGRIIATPPRNDAEGYLLCPTCGGRATSAVPMGTCPGSPDWESRCSNHHRWSVTLVDGDKTNNSKMGGIITHDFMWHSVPNSIGLYWEAIPAAP